MYKPTNNWVKIGELKAYPQIKEFLDSALSKIPDNSGYEGITIYKNPKSQNVMLHHTGRLVASSNYLDKKLLKIFYKNDFNFVFRIQVGKNKNVPYGHVIAKPSQSRDEMSIARKASDAKIGPRIIDNIPNPISKSNRDRISIEQYISATEGWHPLYYQRKTVARDLAIKTVKNVFDVLHGPGIRSVFYLEGVEQADNYPKTWASEIWKHTYFNAITGEALLIDFGSASEASLEQIEKEDFLVDRLLREMDTHNF